MKRFARWLRQPIPLTVGTAIYCFLQGAMLSIPTGYFLAPIRPFEPPALVMEFVATTAFVSVPAMVLWCLVLGRKYPNMSWFGFTTFLLFLLHSILFPPLY